MNKSDLKNGMVLIYRGGQERLFLEGELIDSNFSVMNHIDNYTDDFKYTYGSAGQRLASNALDIVSIEDLTGEELWNEKEVNWNEVPVGTKVLVSDSGTKRSVCEVENIRLYEED